MLGFFHAWRRGVCGLWAWAVFAETPLNPTPRVPMMALYLILPLTSLSFLLPSTPPFPFIQLQLSCVLVQSCGLSLFDRAVAPYIHSQPPQITWYSVPFVNTLFLTCNKPWTVCNTHPHNLSLHNKSSPLTRQTTLGDSDRPLVHHGSVHQRCDRAISLHRLGCSKRETRSQTPPRS